ncbi:rhodanese-related sulfurtransferase [Kaistia dalseonensis]|uniref:tRNA uridine(34) hydroxylase n=1 Tax=Kaistia dalseonensis TaxID=410840 RepID=A0ABU0H0F0_9HYPH|nr:rhodanese-related sulfurtransferase [Kaistia dalseonensis]MCX5493229.1 rhodanese-related sulfurtransferase [Kaistia dalseonensis]MDQ0435784.1 UPF0176 protein [Kaistia dalseonensis]
MTDATTTFRVAALYQFVSLPDHQALQAPLLELCSGLGIKGTLLIAEEGINGTIAGTAEAIDGFLAALGSDPIYGGRFGAMEIKFSGAVTMPFKRLKVKLRDEIVTLGKPQVDPTRRVGTYVEPEDWNALISDPDVLLIDTRNRFEVEMGSFAGAVDPETRKFSQFPEFVSRTLDPGKHKRVAMFCTGGIRCEKASSYLLAEGFEEVFHLKGGILKYLETVPEEESLWRGECFVFDERIALGHGLVQRPSSDLDPGDAGA